MRLLGRDSDEERICRSFHVPYWIGLNKSKPSWLRRPLWRARAHWWYWRHHRRWLRYAVALAPIAAGILIGNFVIPFHDDRPRLVQEAAPPAATHGVVARSQRLAWAPVAGATYHVELLRGTKHALARDVETPYVDATVRPGEYRWLVWPVRDGYRESTAIVNATLRVQGVATRICDRPQRDVAGLLDDAYPLCP